MRRLWERCAGVKAKLGFVQPGRTHYRYLHLASNNEWWVSGAESKDACEARGWAHSETMGPRRWLPTDARMWSVFSDSDWQSQQLQVGAAMLKISGAQGTKAGAINGLFEQRNEGERQIWKKRTVSLDADHTYVYLSTMNRWCLGSARDKDLKSPVSYLASDVMDPDSLPTDARKWTRGLRVSIWLQVRCSS